MPKHDDDKITVSVVPPTVDAPERLRRVPGTVDDAGLAIIRRAVLLRLATLGELEPESQESTGRAIVAICRLYLTGESARLSEKGVERC